MHKILLNFRMYSMLYAYHLHRFPVTKLPVRQNLIGWHTKRRRMKEKKICPSSRWHFRSKGRKENRRHIRNLLRVLNSIYWAIFILNHNICRQQTVLPLKWHNGISWPFVSLVICWKSLLYIFCGRKVLENTFVLNPQSC